MEKKNLEKGIFKAILAWLCNVWIWKVNNAVKFSTENKIFFEPWYFLDQDLKRHLLCRIECQFLLSGFNSTFFGGQLGAVKIKMN